MKKLIIYVLLLFLLSSCVNNTNSTIETNNDISIDDPTPIQENNIKDYDEELGVGINDNNFPDKEFIEYIKENIDIDNNDYLSNEEIENVRSIDIDNNNKIENLNGIEYFINLEKLICYNCVNLSSINIDDMEKLKVLGLYYIPISNINLSNNIKLETIGLYGTNIDNIKVYSTSNPISIGVGQQKKDIIVDISNCSYLKNNIYDKVFSISIDDGLYIDFETLEKDNYIEIVCDNKIIRHSSLTENHRSCTYFLGQGNNNIVNSTFNTYEEALNYGYNGNKWYKIESHKLTEGIPDGDSVSIACEFYPIPCTYSYEVIVYDEQPF